MRFIAFFMLSRRVSTAQTMDLTGDWVMTSSAMASRNSNVWIAMVLGSSMRYDIAEVVDPQVHVVAKLSKSILAPIPKPE